MLSMIIANIKMTIYLDPSFGWCPEFTDAMKDDLVAQGLTYEDECSIKYSEINSHSDELVLYQWGSGKFLNNSQLYIEGVPMILHGIAQSEFTDNLFYSPPEFNIYLSKSSNNFDTSLALNFTQSQILMNRTVTNATQAIGSSVRVQSLLNPDNIHVFFYDYTFQKYEDIKKRFALNSN